MLALDEIVARALQQGITQVESAGSPLHPFLLDETGTVMLLYDDTGSVDPMELALQAIKTQRPGIQRCALVIDSRVTLADGKKWDAIVAMACDRAQPQGVVMAQRYVPKGLFRKVRSEGVPEQIGQARNFIEVALADPSV